MVHLKTLCQRYASYSTTKKTQEASWRHTNKEKKGFQNYLNPALRPSNIFKKNIQY